MANADRMTTPDMAPVRVASLDVYRGFVMFLLLAELLKFHHIAEHFPSSSFWNFLAEQQSHVEWVGCTLHDMIQPSFSFLVGAALPYSLAHRAARGESSLWSAGHALLRAFILIFLGIFLRSQGAASTNFTFEDTLTQIGLGYFPLYGIGHLKRRGQWLGLALLLLGTWLAFAAYPAPPADFPYSDVGVPADWPHHATGFAAHWNKNSNLAWAFDTWFLNLFPREAPFRFNGGGYSTLSFLPTLATMVLGLLAGGTLRNQKSVWETSRWLFIVGIVAMAGGWTLNATGLCPLVKRIWTPGFMLWSGGVSCLILLFLYLVLDVAGVRAWAFPFKVIGMNSIAAYLMDGMAVGYIKAQWITHLGSSAFTGLGEAFAPTLLGAATLLTIWSILYWMYRRRIFLRI